MAGLDVRILLPGGNTSTGEAGYLRFQRTAAGDRERQWRLCAPKGAKNFPWAGASRRPTGVYVRRYAASAWVFWFFSMYESAFHPRETVLRVSCALTELFDVVLSFLLSDAQHNYNLLYTIRNDATVYRSHFGSRYHIWSMRLAGLLCPLVIELRRSV